MFVNAGFIVGFDSEKGSVAEAMIECVEATAIPFCMVGLLYALPTTQLTRRLAREGRLYPPAYTTERDTADGMGDQCTSGLNFETARPRRDILADYRTILARIYEPVAYYARVRRLARLLDRPVLDKTASADPPRRSFLGVPLGDLALLRRLLWRIATRQPRTLWPFCKTLYDCALNNPRAIDYVGILAAIYLHLGPFSRHIMATVDREIADIDAGRWHPPQPALPEPEPAREMEIA
jgi:hypothetical protein